MPTLPDLELNDFDLKPYMDPSILLDTFSAEDIDIWQSYNLFVDDNINSSIKEQIKEENTDLMDCCFSSICPNDLINNVDNDGSNKDAVFNYQNQYSTSDGSSQLSYDTQSSKNVIAFGDEFYSTNSSSCSSSPSIESNQYFKVKQPISMNLDINYQQMPQQCLTINNENNFQHVFDTNNHTNINQLPIVIDSSKVEFFQINNNLKNETLLSPSSSLSSSTSSNTSELNNLTSNQLQKSSKKIQKLNEIQQQQQPIIIVEAAKNKPNPTTQSNSQKLKRSASILPPSPPSSFGSDSESNQSTTSSTNQNTKLIGQKSSKLLKSSKLNSSMRNSSTIIKHMRHQPYSFKQAQTKSAQKTKVTIKTESVLDTSNSLLNLSTNSDDDCWPFLCSLSKLPSSGPIMLTEEEKRTLVQEGHQVPAQLPLSKSEEKVLKKIRRKIKNKISAQESRRKKKEYVDSLEKRMENYINENVQLKKRLEHLELNNKNLMQQMQKMQVSISQDNKIDFQNDLTDESSTTTSNTLNITSANQFGTLLMVLVLFFTVLLGVWSPLISKEVSQASATAAAAASIGVRSNRANVNSMPFSAASATTTAAVAVASLAVASSVAQVKSESLSPAQGNGDEAMDDPGMHLGNFSLKNIIVNDDEDDFLANDAILTGQVNNNNLTTMSKRGTAVELTKVRPFIRKLSPQPQVNQLQNPISQQQQSQNSDYVIMNNQNQNQEEAQQIIILNLAPQQQQQQQQNNPKISEFHNESSLKPSGCVQQAATQNNIPVNFVNSLTNSQTKSSNLIGLNQSANNPTTGYRVINTVQPNNSTQKVITCNTTNPKLPTRFRLINNGINSYNSHHLTTSVIKLNTLA